MTLDGLELTGRVPAMLEETVLDLHSSGARKVSYGPRGNPGINGVGMVLRVQDTANGVLTRPVLVGCEWADRGVGAPLPGVPRLHGSCSAEAGHNKTRDRFSGSSPDTINTVPPHWRAERRRHPALRYSSTAVQQLNAKPVIMGSGQAVGGPG
ncbi:hypothetical protein [Streptomyces litmocidini]|uniref:Uncharacterized protein n=1 Tax=Streptomyces litmocidini TaxID=67318 RepID=A0ABW7U7R8_9ACTN